ncbi:UNVERIFIED_CONTAM: hypothetical protein K2H54_027376 [Gekko kuhli]
MIKWRFARAPAENITPLKEPEVSLVEEGDHMLTLISDEAFSVLVSFGESAEGAGSENNRRNKYHEVRMTPE